MKGSAVDVLLLRTNVYDVVLAMLLRGISDAETLTTERSLAGAIQKLVNRVRINATKLEVYETDDATISYEQSLTTDENADPIVEVDTD